MFNTNFNQICYVSYKKEVNKKRVWVSLGLSHKSSKASEKRTFNAPHLVKRVLETQYFKVKSYVAGKKILQASLILFFI